MLKWIERTMNLGDRCPSKNFHSPVFSRLNTPAFITNRVTLAEELF